MSTGEVINGDSSRETTGSQNGAGDRLTAAEPALADPFFVVGAHRSGTTLLRYMLSSHPRLYLPPESEFISAYFGRSFGSRFLGRGLFGRGPSGTLERRRARRLLRSIFRQRFVREWQGEAPSIDDLCPGTADLTPAGFLDALYRAYAEQHGAQRWGDKTPLYASHMGLLNALFPRASFIHIIRDGRDVALSVLDTWGGRRAHVDLGFAALTWKRRIADARASAASLPGDRYLEIRYEDLVREPEAQIRPLCAFLGEEFHPAMLEPHRLARRWVPEGSFHEALRHPLQPARVQRWRRDMTASDRRVFEAMAGATLVELGYESAAEGPLSPAERLRVAGLKAKYTSTRSARLLLQLLRLRMPN